MGIYIKDAALPKSCWACELGMVDQLKTCPFYASKADEQENYKAERHPNCPLVEVQAGHGRLIDELALKKDLLKRGFYPVFVKCALKDAPTIIEEEWAEDRTLRVKLDFNHLMELIDETLGASKDPYVEKHAMGIGMGLELLCSYMRQIAERAIELNDEKLLSILMDLHIINVTEDTENGN